MLSDYADKNRYSFDESRNLSCAWDYRSFSHDISVVTPSQTFTWEISRLSLTYDSYVFSHSDAYHPRGSVSLDSQSPSAPCESNSLATARNDVKGNIVTGSDNGISEK